MCSWGCCAEQSGLLGLRPKMSRCRPFLIHYCVFTTSERSNYFHNYWAGRIREVELRLHPHPSLCHWRRCIYGDSPAAVPRARATRWRVARVAPRRFAARGNVLGRRGHGTDGKTPPERARDGAGGVGGHRQPVMSPISHCLLAPALLAPVSARWSSKPLSEVAALSCAAVSRSCNGRWPIETRCWHRFKSVCAASSKRRRSIPASCRARVSPGGHLCTG